MEPETIRALMAKTDANAEKAPDRLPFRFLVVLGEAIEELVLKVTLPQRRRLDALEARIAEMEKAPKAASFRAEQAG